MGEKFSYICPDPALQNHRHHQSNLSRLVRDLVVLFGVLLHLPWSRFARSSASSIESIAINKTSWILNSLLLTFTLVSLRKVICVVDWICLRVGYWLALLIIGALAGICSYIFYHCQINITQRNNLEKGLTPDPAWLSHPHHRLNLVEIQ